MNNSRLIFQNVIADNIKLSTNNMFWKILYDMWYDCVTMNRRYNLNNFTEFPKNPRGKCLMSNTYFYCRFSAVFNLATPTALSVCNCSHSYLTDL